jgi:nickel/cobalt transporter (NicO) family protein
MSKLSDRTILWRRGLTSGATGILFWLAHASVAFAVRTPFGIATPDSSGAGFNGPLGGFFVWVALRQAEFYQALTSALSSLKTGGHAFWLLAGVSFLYGIFHAVGPGHGKSVITSYLLVTRQTARRGIVISFAAGLMQAVTAIVVVLGAAVILKATAIGMTQTTNWFLIFSYGLVAAVGAWLLWSKIAGRGHHHHVYAYAHDAHSHDAHSHDAHDHHGHIHGLGDHHHHAHVHAGHSHEHDHGGHAVAMAQAAGAGALTVELDAEIVEGAAADCGHSHAPDPRLLSKPLTLRRAWAAILAVGIRPCTGAIIVLVFALSQGLLLAGIGSVLVMALGTSITVSSLAILAVSAKDVALRFTKVDSPTTERVVRVLEICVAVFVMLLGLTLLGGALAGGLPGT